MEASRLSGTYQDTPEEDDYVDSESGMYVASSGDHT
jgi:hypothetical protein